MTHIQFTVGFLALVGIIAVYMYMAKQKPGVALISSPFVASLLAITGSCLESVTIVVVSLFLFPLTLAAILIPKRPPDADTWYRTAAKWCFMLIVLPIAVAALCVLNEFLGIIGFAVTFTFIWASIVYASTSRFSTAAFVLSTIGYCVRQNLPLPMAMDSAAMGQNDNRLSILVRIKKWLVQGYPLSEAIRLGYPQCPGRALAAIAAAQKVHQLPRALASIEKDLVARADDRRRIRPVHPWYPIILLSFLTVIILLLFKFVVPRFISILGEMTETLPLSTRILMMIVNFFVYRYGWLFGLILLFLCLFGTPYSIRVRFRARRPDKPYLVSRIGDFAKWHLPIFHWFERNYSLVQVIEALRLSLNAGCPVNEAIENTLSLDVNLRFRKRIKKWLELVESGENISASALKCGMGKPIAWAFDENANGGNALSVLETLETFYRSNYSYCVNLARFILWPSLTVLLGLIVGFVVYSFFAPMVQVIRINAALVTP